MTNTLPTIVIVDIRPATMAITTVSAGEKVNSVASLFSYDAPNKLLFEKKELSFEKLERKFKSFRHDGVSLEAIDLFQFVSI